MSARFKILFAVDIVHDYFSNGVCTHFRFVPSAETAALMTDCNAMFKSVGNKLLVLIKTGEDSIPINTPTVTDRFVFFMELLQPVFMNISAPDFGKDLKRFYFTNLHQNKFSFAENDDVLYLTKKLGTYDSNESYLQGAIVTHNSTSFECVENADANESPGNDEDKWVSRLKNPSGTLRFPAYDEESSYIEDDFVTEDGAIYQCIQDAPTHTVPSKSDQFWKIIADNQFASNDDLLFVKPKQFTYSLAVEATQVKIEVKGLKTNNNEFDEPVFTEVQSFEKVVKQVSIDLSRLAETKYKLLVNDEESWIYISNQAAYKSYFGVIELFNHLPNGNSFAFYKEGEADVVKDEKIGSKNTWLNYTIRFANRLAYVKYIVPNRGVLEVTSEETPDFFEAFGNPPQSFKSRQRVPMQQASNEFKVRLKKQITPDPTFPAPNPDINAPGMLSKDETDYYCNIYLNY